MVVNIGYEVVIEHLASKKSLSKVFIFGFKEVLEFEMEDFGSLELSLVSLSDCLIFLALFIAPNFLR